MKTLYILLGFLAASRVHATTVEDTLQWFAHSIKIIEFQPCKHLANFGTSYGGHTLCTTMLNRHKEKKDCLYINYGIEQDYSFDVEFANYSSCMGVALDPTVTHKSEIVPNVFFLKLAAPTLEKNVSTKDWQVVSPPKLWHWLGERHVFAVKYDCEGCEYALMTSEKDDEMERFFEHVHQLNIEFHLHTSFLDSKEKLQNLANLLNMLRRHNFHLIHVAVAGCGRDRKDTKSCTQEMYDAGIPCEGHDCSSFLFMKTI